MLVDIASCAALLQCHPESIRRWVRDGKIPSCRVPGGLRIDLAKLDLPHDTRARLVAEWRSALDRAAQRMLAS